MLPSLYSLKNRTVESTVGGGGGLPGAGMRLEAVRAVDGLADSQGTPVADGWGTEEAVRCAVSPADNRGTPVANGGGGQLRRRLVGQPRRTAGRPPGGRKGGRRGGRS